MVNDYHLLLVPRMIREKHPQAMIGLFLHISFPSSEVFRCVEKRKQLLEGMLASNVIGFQTEAHCQHFKQTCSRLLYVETTDCGLQREHSFVHITALPIGIDPKQLSRDIEALEIKRLSQVFASRYSSGGMKVIVGRDKIDHVKGVKHKLRAFGEFLRCNPEWQGRVVLLQFGAPSTPVKTDPALHAEVLDLVSKINSKFSIVATDYQPVIMRPDVSYQEYLALLTMADVFIVSSVREGMNLSCHEYIFCQSEKKNPLILSEFVGSADVLSSDALMINPYSYKQTAEAIEDALTMSDAEKLRRWTSLNTIVHEEDGGRWAQLFIQQISSNFIDQMKRRSIDLPRLSPEAYQVQYAQAKKRLIVIDFEETLIQWQPNKGLMAGTGKIVDLLNQLCAVKGNIVYVTSERTPSELERTFRRVQHLGLIAENGGYVRSPEEGTWESLTDPTILGWKDNVREIVQYYKERTPGTFIEEQSNRIIFHYANTDCMITAQRQVSEMNNHIGESSAAQDCHAIPMKDRLIIEPASISKATAMEHVFKQLPAKEDIAFVVVFGNDRSDEETYIWANHLPKRLPNANVTCLTVNVEARNTEAKWYVQSTFGVVSTLEKWANQ